MEKLHLNRKHQEKDSEVFGAIWAGAKSRKKPLKPDLEGMETPEGMCAVGAGNRGRKVTKVSDVITKSYQQAHGVGMNNERLHQLIPLVRFATVMEVSENYACGVNDGFEDSTTAAKSFYPNVDRNSLDYKRGYHVGQAIRIESGIQ
jgi:hypothetical protein